MTENEAIKVMKWYSEEEYGKGLVSESHRMAIQALEKVQQFEAIGTIEEFKALKNKHIGKDNMVISSSDLMTILNSDEKEIRNKAIDEFAERIKRFVDCGHLCSPTEIRWSDLSIVEMIDRIAEQLKGGAV